MKVFKNKKVFYFTVISLLLFVASSAVAESIPTVSFVEHTVKVVMRNEDGTKMIYEIMDGTKKGKKTDGLIDSARFTKKVNRSDIDSKSQIPIDANFPLTITIEYFHKDYQFSDSVFGKKGWLDAFCGRIAVCTDRFGNTVSPKGGEWKTWKINGSFMQKLQRMFSATY